jgi:hypothetical protein
MAYTTTRDITKFWDVLGTSWYKFETRDPIEQYWNAIGHCTDQLNSLLSTIQRSRSLQYMSGLVDEADNFYFIVYSGIDANTQYVSGNDLFEYLLDDTNILSIPTLVRYYYDTSDVLVSGIYTEGTDYTISGLNTLRWKRTSGYPTPDPRFINGQFMLVYAPHTYKIDPVLLNVWAPMIDLSSTVLTSDTYTPCISGVATLEQQYEHMKNFVWALAYKKTQSPTIKTLTDGIGIAHGLPFAYTSGLLSSVSAGDHCIAYIDDYPYILPSGTIPVPAGPISQFSLLVSGLHVYDWVNGYDTIAGIVDNTLQIRKTLYITCDNTLSNILYDTDFYNIYVSGIMPVHFFLE